MFDLSQESLQYAAYLELSARKQAKDDTEGVDGIIYDSDAKRVGTLEKRRKRKKLFFFNSEDVERLKPFVREHQPKKVMWGEF